MTIPVVQTLQTIPAEQLLETVRAMRAAKQRLVHITATRLPECVELTYGFDLESNLTSYRIILPAAQGSVPSISSIYPCGVLYENEISDLFKIRVEGMAVDFKGNFYKTAVAFPFGSTKAQAIPAKPAPRPAAVKPVPSAPASAPASPPVPASAAAAGAKSSTAQNN